MASTFSPSRLEAFSDGVIAVIITIMVLELKVPHESGASGLRAVVPTLLVYLLSFTFTGVYWVNHHELIGRLHKCNNRILWANLAWLFALSLMPFFTAFVIEHHLDSFSTAVYSASMLLAGATFLLLRYAVDCQLIREQRSTAVSLSLRLKHWGSLGFYTLGIILAPWEPKLALASTACVTLIWIVPTLGLFESHDEATTSPPTEMLSR
jgi:uncharacterized membrane protein